MDAVEIMEEIERLKHGNTTYSNAEKLAILSMAHSVLEPQGKIDNGYSFAVAPKSEFVNACLKSDAGTVFEILDEHMNAIKILYPKEYQSVIRKINRLTND